MSGWTINALLGRPSNGGLKGAGRLKLLSVGFGLCLLVIAGRAGQITLVNGWMHPAEAAPEVQYRIPRPNIVDRNGALLATDISIPSLYAEPRKIIDVDEAVEMLTATIPDLNARELRRKLTQDRAFVWLKRQISPEQRAQIHNLGLPAIGFREERRRVYPMGRMAAHVVGYVDVDSRGLAGIEKYLDDQGALYKASLADPERRAAFPATLSVDMRIQHALVSELAEAIPHFKAVGGAGLVLDVTTGEVLACASLPDYNPNDPKGALRPENLNKITAGVFELGSVVKAVTFAMAFESGRIDLNSRFDARFPLIVGRQRIDDYRGQRRILSVPEIFTYSSNIGTARMALEVGVEQHYEFLKKVGLFSRLRTEVPESAAPLLPRRWSKINTITASFGHGFAVQPLQGVSVIAAFLNGGKLIPPTFLKRDAETAASMAEQIIKPSTSEKLRYLFRLNATEGSAKKANVPGYRIGGKTGTAEKVVNGRYSHERRLTSFIGAFPMEAPRYVLLVMLDEPKPVEGTYGFATSGWNAVPTGGKILERIAPLLGIEPQLSDEERRDLEKVAAKRTAAKGN